MTMNGPPTAPLPLHKAVNLDGFIRNLLACLCHPCHRCQLCQLCRLVVDRRLQVLLTNELLGQRVRNWQSSDFSMAMCLLAATSGACNGSVHALGTNMTSRRPFKYNTDFCRYSGKQCYDKPNSFSQK
jgi:hypothetical protein